MDDLISIIVPVYNVASYLGKCLDSIRNQFWHNLEIILVDDGSTDGSGDICDKYREKDPRFIVIHQENQGALAARNAGIRVVHGQYVGFVDGDDWISERTYQDMYQALKEHGAELAICKKSIYNDETGVCFAESDVLEEGYYAGRRHAEILLHLFESQEGTGISLNLYDKLFSRRLIEQNYEKVDIRLRYFEDMALSLLCVLEADGIVIRNRENYFYRQRKGSLCHSIDQMYLEQLNIFYHAVCTYVAEYSGDLLSRLSMYVAERAIYGLNYMMGLSLRHKIPYFVPPVHCLRKDDKVVVYGAGEVGRSYYRIFELTRPGQIVLWTDRQYKKLQDEGVPVQDIYTLKNTEFDKVIIAVKFRNSAAQIKADLLKMGISSEKIIWEPPAVLTGDGRE